MSNTQQPEALRFTKKPVTIVASQWFKSGDHPAVRDISDSDDLFFTGMGGATLVEREKFGVIGTLESPNHLVTPGDWIITGVQGEHYPCKPDIFEATYTPETKLEAQLSAIGAGGVEPLRKQVSAPQAVHPENIREGAPYDNPEFEQLARNMGVWGTPQAALCAQFWLAATQPADAPVVPQGWKPVPVGWQFYEDGKWWNGDDRIKDHRKNTEEARYPIRDVYAVEQQSAQPDAAQPNSLESGRIKTEAAPMQMPEPAGWRDPTNLLPSQGCTYMRAIHEKWPHVYREPLYTEQQVRALLGG